MEFKDIKEIAEFIYYLSWPVVIFGIRAAWLQLKAFNDESTTRFKRESIITSIEILEKKSDQINASFCKAFELESLAGAPKHLLPIIGYSSTHNTFSEEWKKWYYAEDQIEFSNHITDSLNHLETLSQYVFSGVADEEMCYKFECAPILKFINEMMLYIAEARTDDDDPLYEGIVNLHKTWTARLHHDTSQKELVKAKQNAGAQKAPKAIPVLGVKQ
ncbi:DUF4760 domain-containing protein [Pseudomonas sivasensis]|uniref:DUF4760 domain-containing protein n=1 Tax=Pseudomonas sivasensis TaxID=1880678 RepID=UPI003D064518